MYRSGRLIAVGAVTVIAVLAACDGNFSLVTGDNGLHWTPSVEVDHDSLRVAGTTPPGIKYTTSYTCWWPNSGTSARASWTSAITSGTVTLGIFDTHGLELFRQPVSAHGTYLTSVADSGTWMVVVTFENFTGTVDIRVLKA